MKKLLLLGLVFTWACSSQAQPMFEKLYDGVTSFRLNLTELPSGHVLVGLGRTRAVSIVNPIGNIVHTHSYWATSSNPVTGIGGIRRRSDNEYLFTAGYMMDSCTSNGTTSLPNIHPLIGKIDSMGNLLDIRHFVLNEGCQNIGNDLVTTADGGMITWGYERSFFAIKADSDLTPVWSKLYSHIGGIQFIKELPSGDLIAGMNMDTAGAVVARLDANGNVLWCKSYIRPKGMIHDAIIESDNSFIISGYTDSTASTNIFEPTPPTYQPKLFLMKLAGDGQVQWCRGYQSPTNLWYARSGSHIEKSHDGNYALVATLGQPEHNFFYRPFLMKTDINGDTLWTRTVGASGYNYYAKDLMDHSDGGYILSGFIWGNLPDGNSSLPYLFKADSLGRFSCGEQWHPITISNLFPTDSSFTLASVDGITVLPAYVIDTTLAPIVRYDGCTFSTALPQAIRVSQHKPHIYPNPNTGRFTVEFADPLLAESYYSVYDALGKLLYQRPLPTGATLEEIDLSRYGRGTYAIKFTSPDGVCYERVVLE